MNILNVPSPILGLIYSFGDKKNYLSSILVCKVWSKIKASVDKCVVKYSIVYSKRKGHLHKNTWWLCRNSLRELTYRTTVIATMCNEEVKIICEFKNLRRLHLELKQNHENMELISQLEKLESVRLDCTMVVDDGWMKRNLFKETLKELILVNCLISSLGWMTMVPNLESLVLNDCMVPEHCFCGGTFDGKNLLKLEINAKYSFRHFDYIGYKMGDDVLRQIGKMSQLEELVFRSNYVQHVELGNMVNLKKLLLNCDMVKGISSLVKLVNLRELVIYGGYDSNEELCEFGKLINLRILVVDGYRGGRHINDDMMLHWKGMVGLKSLGLYRCDFITDVGLLYLGEMEQLCNIKLSFCGGITNEGIINLRKLGKNVNH